MRILLLIHLLGVVVWIGGMFFAHTCLRPEAARQLPPPQRLPLLEGILGRFFQAVAVAIVAIFATGLLRFADLHGAPAPAAWHTMAGIATIMLAIFAYIVIHPYRALRRAVESQSWQDGGKAMDAVRKLVFTNLVLGVLVIVIAFVG